MPAHILSSYVLPGESTVDAAAVVEAVNAFISSRSWKCSDVWAVSQMREDGEGELGLNLALPDVGREVDGWYEDVEAVVSFSVQLRREIDRDFVISLAHEAGAAEDVMDIDSDEPNTMYLRQFIGVEAPPEVVKP